MSLFVLDMAFKEAIEMYSNGVTQVIDEGSGEIIPIAEYLESIQMERETKIDNCVLYIKTLDYEEKALDEEIKKLTERKNQKKNRKEVIKKYVASILNGEKRETPQYKISWRKSESVEIAEGASIPEEFLVPQEPKADKKALKKAIKNGAVFEGISLVEKVNMSVK